ncbi:MAG TPA: hypothetical protein VHX65_10055 [Pirellulales bacterium]|jgi:hypothetical protein|nr:hypothetical protein [Pirellulales bacterium]
MLRIGFGLALGLALLATASNARANDWDDFWDSVHVDWHRNNEWPHPFTEIDRAATMAPFAVQIANGWQRENLLGEEYFNENTKILTAAGRNRIRTILVQSPPEHRVIFVERDLSDEVTAKRLDSAQQAVAALLPQGSLPDVLVSNMMPASRSAEEVNSELKSYINSTPTARLTGGGAKSGGASSGAGGGAPGGAAN